MKSPGKRLFHTLSPLVGLVLGLALTIPAWLFIRHEESRVIQLQQEARTELIFQLLKRRIRSMEKVLEGAAAFLGRGPLPSNREWREYVERLNIQRDYPGIQGLGFAEWIPEGSLARHEARIRATGYLNYKVQPGGPLPPAPEGRSSIIYLEPMDERNQRAFGRDMHAEILRREAMNRARDTGRTVLTGRVRLYQEGDKDIQFGTLLYAPVYRFGAPLATVEERRQSFRGWAYYPLRMTNLVEGILRGESEGLDVHLFDVAEGGPRDILYDSNPATAIPGIRVTTRTMEAGGRPWGLVIEPNLKGSAALGAGRHWGALITGSLASLFLAGFFYTLTLTERQALRLADEQAARLLASEAQFRAIFESAPIGMALVEIASRRFLTVNPRMCETFGYPREAFLRLNLARLSHPQDAAWDQSLWDRLVSGTPEPIQMERRFIHRDGHQIQGYLGMVPLPSEPGDPPCCVILLEDITERKTAVKALAESESSFRNFFEKNSSVMMLIEPGSGRIVNANHAAETFYGHPRAKLLAMRIDEINLMPPEEIALERHRAIREDRAHFRFPHRLASGEVREVEVYSTPTLVAGNTLLFSIVHDVTERARADAALQESERRFRTQSQRLQEVIWGTDAGTWEWNVQTGETIFNERWAQILGFTLRELSPVDIDTWTNLSHPEDLLRSRELQRRCFERESPTFECETRMRHKDGHWVWVLDRGSVVEWTEDGKPLRMSGTHQDITERKSLEEEIRHRQVLLEDLNRSLDGRVHQALDELREKDQMLIIQGRQAAMGEMIGNIAHQWRQPLNALGMILSNLKDAYRFGELDLAHLERSVADGSVLVQEMSSTINDFRNFFRPDKEPSAFSALAQIRQAMAMVDAGFRNTGITLEIQSQGDMILRGFPNEYSQVILNLLTNAQHAIQKSGTQGGLVTIALSTEGNAGCVHVRDNGGGIPSEILEKVFEPYFSTKEMGTGIGLYMSKQIIERSMGGRIEARNIDRGAEFTISTPLGKEGP